MVEKFTIRFAKGLPDKVIEGERCLQAEYPELNLFVGYYPGEYGDPTHITYQVCEVSTGASIYPSRHSTKEDAIAKATSIITKYGIREALKRKDVILEGMKAKCI